MAWGDMPESVKKRYTWENGILSLGKTMISDYYVRPVQRFLSPSGEKEYLAVQYVVGEDETVYTLTIEADAFTSMELPMRMMCNDYKRSSRGELLILLKMQMRQLPEPDWYIDSVGWHFIENQWIYCGGSEIFSPDPGLRVNISQDVYGKFQIRYDDSTPEETLDSMQSLIRLNSIPANLCLVYLVTGLLRSLFFSVDIPPRFLLYLSGSTGTYKTTIAKYFFDIYGRGDGTSFATEDFTSSEAALQSRIQEFRDCVFILDDLSPGVNSRETMRKQNVANNFIRTAANCEKRLTKSGNHIQGEGFACSIAITAENILELESLVNRTLLIDMDKYPLSQEILDFFLHYPALVPSFVRIFLMWAAENTELICRSIRLFWDNYRENHDSETPPEHPRLRDTMNILSISTQILIYFFELYNPKVKEMADCFVEALDVVQKDEEHVLRGLHRQTVKWDISREIVNLINTRQIMQTMPAFGGEAYIHKEYLYIQPKYLLEQLEKVINDEEFSVHKLSSYLGKKGLLVKDNSRDYTKKNSNGKRYYQIDLKRLEEETNMYLMTEP